MIVPTDALLMADMIRPLTRAEIIKYWAKGPLSHLSQGVLMEDSIPFPDVEWLTTAERDILRPVLERHPEYLIFEIPYRYGEKIQ